MPIPLRCGLAARLVSVIGVAYLIACSGGDSLNDPSQVAKNDSTPKIASSTRVIDSTAARLVSDSASLATGLYIFKNVQPPTFAVGDIIVGAQAGGFLRRVTGVTTNGDVINVSTVPAKLSDAVERGYFQINRGITLGSGEITGEQSARLSQDPNVIVDRADGVSVSADGLTLSNVILKSQVCSNQAACVALTLKIPKGTVSFDPSLDIGGNISTPSFHAIATGVFEANASAEVTLSGAAKGEFRKPLFSVVTTSVALIGAVPVVVVSELQIVAVLSASVDARTTASSAFVSQASITAGVRYEKSAWSGVSSGTRSFEGQPVVINGGSGVEVKFALRPELQIFLYGVAGPFISVDPYAKLEGTIGVDQSLTERGAYGLDAEIGAKIEMLNITATNSFQRALIQEREFYRKVTPGGVLGTYTLQSVGGVPLPAPTFAAGIPTVVGTATAGSFTLTNDGRFTNTRNITPINGTPIVVEATGTYTVSGTTINFTQSDGRIFPTAHMSGNNTLTTNFNSQDWVYKK